MTPRISTARERMVATTSELLRRQGYHATGLNQIVEESQAPKGSLYHYFPGGKEELAVEAVHQAAREMQQDIGALTRGSADTQEALSRMADYISEKLETTNFQNACPISTVALETATDSPALQRACSDAFSSMHAFIQQSLVRDGHAPEAARALANLVLCTWQGGLLLSRTHRDTWPLKMAVDALRRLIPSPAAGIETTKRGTSARKGGKTRKA